MTEQGREPRRWAEAILSQAFRPVDAAWLAAFRILFGTVMCVSMLRFLMYGWVHAFFVKPRFFFTYWGFSWVTPLPEPYMYALFWLLAICAAAMAAGLYFRVSAGLFAVGLAYIQLIDVTNYLNHYYLAWLLVVLLLVSPAGHYWSLDALRTRQKTVQVPFLWSFLFRFQVGVVYTFAGIAKAHGDWLLHGQPLGIWLGANTDMPVLGTVFQWPYVPLLMSWAGFLFDTFVIWFLLWRRSRAWAYAAVLVFHTMTRTLFPIGMFSVIMVLAALVFFPHDWPRSVLRRVSGLRSRAARFSSQVRRLSRLALASVNDARASAMSLSPAGPAQEPRHAWLAVQMTSEGRDAGGAERSGPGRSDRLTAEDDRQRGMVGRASKREDGDAVMARWSWQRRFGLLLVAGYCAFHALMPLRFLVYGGNVRWHEQGMRFSWRVMVREKNGSVTYQVTDPQSGRAFAVAPRAYLTQRQEREMSAQPDLILQLAHRIRDDYQAQFGHPVEVRAEVLVSLNGRRVAPLIDPEVDLAQVRDGIYPYPWVLPAPTSAPPRIRPI